MGLPPSRIAVTLSVFIGAILMLGACALPQRVSWRRTWFMNDPVNVSRRTRRWDDRFVPVAAAFDVERYQLRHGATVLFFRHPQPIDVAFEDVFGRLAAAGWTFSDERASGKFRSWSTCAEGCDDAGRLYVMMREDRTGHVVATVRWPGPTEARKGLRLPGPCAPIRLAEAGGWMPVFDVDLDRDGRLDAFVPRRIEPEARSHSRAVQPRAEVAWDAYVMRGDCGHAVGTFDAVPPSDHGSAPGRRGLIDLAVPVRRHVDGRTQWVDETWWYDGTAYVPKRRRGRSFR